MIKTFNLKEGRTSVFLIIYGFHYLGIPFLVFSNEEGKLKFALRFIRN